MHLWGHRAVRRVLRSTSCSPSWPVVAQASSIGSLGPSPDTWLEGELGRSLGGRRVELVYPSLQVGVLVEVVVAVVELPPWKLWWWK